MLELTLLRFALTHHWTMGYIASGGDVICFVIEDPDRLAVGLPKLMHRTAIPAGTYEVRMTPSQRFGRVTPQLMDVPGFTGVRIHPGNTTADTSGCLLPGRSADLFAGTLRESAKACMELQHLLDNAGARGRIEIRHHSEEEIFLDRLKEKLLPDHNPPEA